MTECFELDRLVAIGGAIDWHVDDALEHLRGCATCRDELARLGALHRAMTETETPRPGFTEQVMQSVADREARRRSARSAIARVLTPTIAGATAFFSVALASSSTDPVSLGPVVAAAIVTGIATAWWNARSPAADAGLPV